MNYVFVGDEITPDKLPQAEKDAEEAKIGWRQSLRGPTAICGPPTRRTSMPPPCDREVAGKHRKDSRRSRLSKRAGGAFADAADLYLALGEPKMARQVAGQADIVNLDANMLNGASFFYHDALRHRGAGAGRPH